MFSLREEIKKAEEKRVAIGHFNISNLKMFWGIFDAVQEISLENGGDDIPIIIGLSEGERSSVGVRVAVAIIEQVRTEFSYPIFINADHSHSLETFREAVLAGYDAAIIDVSDKPLEENIKTTREAVENAKHKNTNMIVEGEIGYIGSSSKVIDEVPEGAVLGDLLPTPDDAKRYVEETGIDLLAPAVGNLHGMFKDHPNPSLNINLIKEIRKSTGVPLVLHGGSGVTDEDFVKAIDAGISIIHVNTEIRVAYRRALEASLKEDPDQVAPYKYAAPAVEAVKDKVKEKLTLFNRL